MNVEELEKIVARHETQCLETACAFKKCLHHNRTRVWDDFPYGGRAGARPSPVSRQDGGSPYGRYNGNQPFLSSHRRFVGEVGSLTTETETTCKQTSARPAF